MNTVIRINQNEYEHFMNVQRAKSWLKHKEFNASFWVCTDTYYSRKYKGRIKQKWFDVLRDKFWEQEGFYDCFYMSPEEHWNTVKFREKREQWLYKEKKSKKVL